MKEKKEKNLTNIIISFSAILEEVIAFFPSGFGAVLGALLGVALGVWWAGVFVRVWLVLVGRNSLTRIGIV